jgi:hypothetical protein
MTTKALRRETVALLALLIAGCGLSDYEGLMRSAQERVSRAEEEAENLGDPVTLPTRLVVTRQPSPDARGTTSAGNQKGSSAGTTSAPERKPVIAYPFFLRLPRSMRPTPDPDSRMDLVYRYPKAGSKGSMPALDPAKSVASSDLPPSGPISGVFEAFLAFGTEPAGAFADKVVRAFPASSEITTSTKLESVPDRAEAVSYDAREFSDNRTAWAVYTRTEGNSTVAVVYRMDKAQRAALDHLVELSLSTLAIGREAEAVRNSYARRPK